MSDAHMFQSVSPQKDFNYDLYLESVVDKIKEHYSRLEEDLIDHDLDVPE